MDIASYRNSPLIPSSLAFSLRSSSSLTNPIVRSYVLPDFLPESTNKLGFVRPPPTGNTPPPTPPPAEDAMVVDGAAPKKTAEEEQLLQMNNERFTVPEVLFNPSTIGKHFLSSDLFASAHSPPPLNPPLSPFARRIRPLPQTSTKVASTRLLLILSQLFLRSCEACSGATSSA